MKRNKKWLQSQKVCLFTSSHYDWSGHRLDSNTYCTVSMGRPCSSSGRTSLIDTLLLPNTVIGDRGNEFLTKFRKLIINDYSIMVKPITSRNPQANAILERVHQTIGNILRSFKVQNMILDDKNPWDGILAPTIIALRATVHTITQYTPVPLIFRRVSITNRRHDTD